MSLQTDGLSCHRANDARIEDFAVFGERSCGTNVTQEVIERAFGLKRNRSYGWKHGRPSFLAAGKRTLFVVSLRNAFDWSVSMYAKPYHAEPELARLPYSEFIRSPWRSVMDAPRAHRLDRSAYLNQPLASDRDPLTGATFANIFEMRTSKIRSLLALCKLGANVVIVQREAFSAHRTLCIDRISAAFDLPIRPETDVFPAYIFKSRANIDTRRAAAKASLDENRPFIRSQLDAAMEAELGYNP